MYIDREIGLAVEENFPGEDKCKTSPRTDKL